LTALPPGGAAACAPPAGDGATPSIDPARVAEVLRILDRYLLEVVERWQLCPWAQATRARGELAVGVLWGAPALAAWIDEGARLLARPGTQVAIVVAPQLVVSRAALAAVRDRVAARLAGAGVAEFHPDAPLDLASPARAVPFARRAPDPLLQLVPLAVLAAARAGAPATPIARPVAQAAMLLGHAAPPRAPIADRIAAANHATLTAAHAEIAATLAAIAADRAASYARVGLTACPSPTG
jgi:hypothetical protein